MTNDHYEEYRLRGAYCREMARLAPTSKMREQWEHVANTWLAMIPSDVELDPDGFYAVSPAEEGSSHRHAA